MLLTSIENSVLTCVVAGDDHRQTDPVDVEDSSPAKAASFPQAEGSSHQPKGKTVSKRKITSLPQAETTTATPMKKTRNKPDATPQVDGQAKDPKHPPRSTIKDAALPQAEKTSPDLKQEASTNVPKQIQSAVRDDEATVEIDLKQTGEARC